MQTSDCATKIIARFGVSMIILVNCFNWFVSGMILNANDNIVCFLLL